MTQHAFHAVAQVESYQPIRPGSTVLISMRIRNQMGYLTAASDPKVLIRDPLGSIVVPATTPMLFSEATRKSSYAWQTLDSAIEGTYLVECTATTSVFGPSGSQDVVLKASTTFSLRRTVP